TFNNLLRVSRDADDPIDFSGAGRESSRFAMQFSRSVSQFTHLSRRKNAAVVLGSSRQNSGHSLQRGGTRVVAVIDHRRSVRKRDHLATHKWRLEIGENAMSFLRADVPHTGSR